MKKEILNEISEKLNKLGYTGGVYYYKKSECSCCYGMDGFFFINWNKASNWIGGN